MYTVERGRAFKITSHRENCRVVERENMQCLAMIAESPREKERRKLQRIPEHREMISTRG